MVTLLSDELLLHLFSITQAFVPVGLIEVLMLLTLNNLNKAYLGLPQPSKMESSVVIVTF